MPTMLDQSLQPTCFRNLLAALIFNSDVQNRALTCGRYLRRLINASNGSPLRDAVLKLTTLKPGDWSMYSTHQTYIPQSSPQSRTNSKVSSDSLPVFANTTQASAGIPSFA